MKKGHFLYGALLCLLLVYQISARCLCAEKGEDYCACQGAIRPVPKLLERIKSAKFPPIGDTCWCGKQLVEPAVPPKPPCKVPPKTCHCDTVHEVPSCFDNLVPSQPRVPHGVPADPISISLALRAGQAFAVPEAKLSYGHSNVPVDGLKKIYFSNTPEEKLYTLNSEVIELKRRVPKREEIIEEEEEEVEEADIQPPCLTYHELGYGPEKYINPKFRRYHNFHHEAPQVESRKLLTGCGFKPGKISQNAKFIDEVPIDLGEDCW